MTENGNDVQERSTNLFTGTLSVESRLVLTLVVFLLIAAVVAWVGFNEPKRMERFTAQYHARSIQRGAVIFDGNCSSCHGKRGEGLEGVAPALNDPALFDGTRLQQVGWTGTLEDYVALTIAAGRPVQSAKYSAIMPTWGQDYGGPLRMDQVRDVANYVLNWGTAPEEEPGVAAPRPTATPSFEAIGQNLDSALPEGDPARGEALFNNAEVPAGGYPLACSGCHSLGGSEGIGPSMPGISGRVPDGYDSLEAYLRESILLPENYRVPGFDTAAMPANFGSQLSAQDLADIIAYLRALE